MEPKKKCPCHHIDCIRHGNCTECRRYHTSTRTLTACGINRGEF